MTARPIPMLSDIRVAAFWVKVDRRGPDECWEWLGYVKPSGYGQVSVGRERFAAHRVSYALVVGDAPAHLDLDHLCRNRACVNPAHLEPVTRRENLRRGVGHGSETHCPQGHSYEDAYRDSDGSRKCRTCVLARAAERYYSRGQAA